MVSLRGLFFWAGFGPDKGPSFRLQNCLQFCSKNVKGNLSLVRQVLRKDPPMGRTPEGKAHMGFRQGDFGSASFREKETCGYPKGFPVAEKNHFLIAFSFSAT
jgi:hypothetical protein